MFNHKTILNYTIKINVLDKYVMLAVRTSPFGSERPSWSLIGHKTS